MKMFSLGTMLAFDLKIKKLFELQTGIESNTSCEG